MQDGTENRIHGFYNIAPIKSIYLTCDLLGVPELRCHVKFCSDIPSWLVGRAIMSRIRILKARAVDERGSKKNKATHRKE